ncbi:hypothetical protein TcCL_NonESM08137 [Trypanosoma cruzi]|nr:hypothetical protein TcCL_NonESM08137 [Trypanosoma cruzi]
MKISTQPEGEVFYLRYKRLATYSSLRDYCVLVNSILLQPDMERGSTKLLSAFNYTAMVYIENAIHCNYRPHCEGYEREIVYAFGYIATSNAGDNCVQVHHIVCVDSKDKSNQRLELAMIQEHITRMAWVRQICEDTQSTSIGMRPSQAPHMYGEERTENPNHDDEEEAASFVEVETLEDVTSCVFTQDSADCMSHPTSLNGSVEELEGIFDRDSSGAGTSFQSASPVRHPQVSDAETHKSHLTPAITTDWNSLVTPTEEVEKQDGWRTTPHAQTELSPSKEYFVFQDGSKQRLSPPQRDFLQVEIVSYRNFLTWSMAKNRVIFFIFRTSAKSAQTARVTFKENSLFQHERLLFEGPQGGRDDTDSCRANVFWADETPREGCHVSTKHTGVGASNTVGGIGEKFWKKRCLRLWGSVSHPARWWIECPGVRHAVFRRSGGIITKTYSSCINDIWTAASSST